MYTEFIIRAFLSGFQTYVNTFVYSLIQRRGWYFNKTVASLATIMMMMQFYVSVARRSLPVRSSLYSSVCSLNVKLLDSL